MLMMESAYAKPRMRRKPKKTNKAPCEDSAVEFTQCMRSDLMARSRELLRISPTRARRLLKTRLEQLCEHLALSDAGMECADIGWLLFELGLICDRFGIQYPVNAGSIPNPEGVTLLAVEFHPPPSIGGGVIRQIASGSAGKMPSAFQAKRYRMEKALKENALRYLRQWKIEAEVIEFRRASVNRDTLLDHVEGALDWILHDAMVRLYGQPVKPVRDGQRPSYSMADLREKTGFSSSSIRMYGQRAGVQWPGKGRKNHRFSLDEALAILREIQARAGDKRIKEKCRVAIHSLIGEAEASRALDANG